MTFVHNDRLLAFASTEQTRYHLTGIYKDAEHFVSTCGHRLYAAKCSVVLSPPMPNDSICDRDAFKANAFKAIEGKYPAYKQLIPDLANYKSVQVTIPDWFKMLKGKKSVCLKVLENGAFLFGEGKCICGINAVYLRELAGLELTMWFKDALCPVVFKDKSDEWTAVVMPMRI